MLWTPPCMVGVVSPTLQWGNWGVEVLNNLDLSYIARKIWPWVDPRKPGSELTPLVTELMSDLVHTILGTCFALRSLLRFGACMNNVCINCLTESSLSSGVSLMETPPVCLDLVAVVPLVPLISHLITLHLIRLPRVLSKLVSECGLFFIPFLEITTSPALTVTSFSCASLESSPGPDVDYPLTW